MKKRAKIVLVILIGIFLTLIAWFGSEEKYQETGNQYQMDGAIGNIANSTLFCQNFTCDYDGLSKISIYFLTNKISDEGTINITLQNNKEIIQEWVIDERDIKDNEYYDLELDNAIKSSKDKQYQLNITSDTDNENVVAIGKITTGKKQDLYIDNQHADCWMMMKFEYRHSYKDFRLVLFYVAVVAGEMLLNCVKKKKNTKQQSRKIGNKKWAVSAGGFTILALTILWPSAFGNMKLMLYSEMSPEQLGVQSDEEWQWAYKGVYYAQERDFQDKDIYEIKLQNNQEKNKVFFSKIVVTLGDIKIQEINSANFKQQNIFENKAEVKDGNIFVKDSNVTIRLDIEKIKTRMNAMQPALIIVCYILMLLCIEIIKYLLSDNKSKYGIRKWYNKEKFSKLFQGNVLIALVLIWIQMETHFMRWNELIVMFISLFVIQLLMADFTQNWKHIYISSVIMLVPTYFSIERMTSYLLVDEPRAITEQLYLNTDIFRHWYMGSSRINYMVMGTILKYSPIKLLNRIGADAFGYAKLVHWLLGLMIVMLICRVIVKYCLPKIVQDKDKCYISAFIYSSMLTASVVLNVLKFYNYDMFSLLFTLLGSVYIYIAHKDRNWKCAVYALICESVAIQEKTIAAPFFILAVMSCSYWLYQLLTKYTSKWLGRIWASLGTILLSVETMWIINEYVGVVVLDGAFPNISLEDVLLPFGNFILRFVEKIIPAAATWSFKYTLCIALVLVGAYVWLYIMDFVTKVRPVHKLISKVVNGRIIVPCMVAGTCILGMICVYLIPTMYLNPVYPNGEGYNTGGNQISALSAYFPVHSGMGYLVCNIGVLIGMAINGIPTVFVIALIGITVALFRNKSKDAMWNIMLLLFLLILPMFYGVVRLTPMSRYMSVSIAGAVLFIAIKLVQMNYEQKIENKIRKNIIAGIMLILAGAETYAFAPAYNSSWPIWNLVPYMEENIESGEVIPVWYGGCGEDLLLAGNEIKAYCQKNEIDTSLVKIYSNYHGTWLTKDALEIELMPGWRSSITSEYEDISTEQFDFGENSFYIFSRWGISWASVPYERPSEEPILKVKYRGGTEAWIYSGNQMKKSIENYVMTEGKQFD